MKMEFDPPIASEIDSQAVKGAMFLMEDMAKECTRQREADAVKGGAA